MSRVATPWQRFVIAHGWKAHAYELAVVLGVPFDEIQRFRTTRTCTRLRRLKRFAELFTLWHGRMPRDDEWPAPRPYAKGDGYEWQAPELALVGSLVGRIGKPELARILTKRLRKITGDRRAERTLMSVQNAITRIGLQTYDVVGGIRVTEAGKEIGAYYLVWNAIKRRELAAFRVGRLWVIPHAAWQKWKATRTFPPKGFIQLSTLRKPLGFSGDKLPEYANMGYIPGVIRCNAWGVGGFHTTKYGTWFIDPKAARKLLADRRAGRPMPWYGKPSPSNLRQTWRLLVDRLHPDTCETCRQIWGPKGAPRAYDDYVLRYPPLAHGAKRHLTRPYGQGLTLDQVAKLCKRSWAGVRLAVNNGTLRATKAGRTHYVTRTDATRWKARKCPVGGNQKSWLSLSAARTQYGFSLKRLRAYIARGTLHSKVGDFGAMRGITYLLKQQVRELREKIGYSEKEGAKRVGVSIERLRVLLAGVNWRGAQGIPPETLRAAMRRRESQDDGYSLEEAALELGRSKAWIHEQVLDGKIRVQRARWDRRRLYITRPMFNRLKRMKDAPRRKILGPGWLYVSAAATLAGVSNGTIVKWREERGLPSCRTHLGYRYPRRSVRARARRHWERPHLKRATPPAWLIQERVRPAANEERAALRMVAAA